MKLETFHAHSHYYIQGQTNFGIPHSLHSNSGQHTNPDTSATKGLSKIKSFFVIIHAYKLSSCF